MNAAALSFDGTPPPGHPAGWAPAEPSSLARSVTRWTRERLQDRPHDYPGVLSWLIAGATRDWRSLLVAYLLGWGLIPMAIGGAALGAVLGGLAGFTGSLGAMDQLARVPVVGLLVTWAWSGLAGLAGAVIGLLMGMALGAVLGFFALPALIALGAYSLGGVLQVITVGALTVLVTFALAIAYTLWKILSEGPTAGIDGYRRLSRREAEWLVPLVHECAGRLGLPNAPRILVDDSSEANAYAMACHIVLTRGLLRMTRRNEEALAAVICHELVHWRNADTVNALAIKGAALPAYLAYNIATRLAGLFGQILLTPMTLGLRYVFLPTEAVNSRAAEFRADQGAVRARLADGMHAALETFREMEAGRTGWDQAVLATHPPTELRMERLAAYLSFDDTLLADEDDPEPEDVR